MRLSFLRSSRKSYLTEDLRHAFLNVSYTIPTRQDKTPKYTTDKGKSQDVRGASSLYSLSESKVVTELHNQLPKGGCDSLEGLS